MAAMSYSIWSVKCANTTHHRTRAVCSESKFIKLSFNLSGAYQVLLLSRTEIKSSILQVLQTLSKQLPSPVPLMKTIEITTKSFTLTKKLYFPFLLYQTALLDLNPQIWDLHPFLQLLQLLVNCVKHRRHKKIWCHVLIFFFLPLVNKLWVENRFLALNAALCLTATDIGSPSTQAIL